MNRFFFTGNATPVEGSEFEDEYTVKVPSEEEVRIVGIRMRNCHYFLTGIDVCREKIFKQYLEDEKKGANGFLACKPLVDSYYYCISQGQYGLTVQEAPSEAQENLNRFQSCLFNKLNPAVYCQGFRYCIKLDLQEMLSEICTMLQEQRLRIQRFEEQKSTKNITILDHLRLSYVYAYVFLAPATSLTSSLIVQSNHHHQIPLPNFEEEEASVKGTAFMDTTFMDTAFKDITFKDITFKDTTFKDTVFKVIYFINLITSPLTVTLHLIAIIFSSLPFHQEVLPNYQESTQSLVFSKLMQSIVIYIRFIPRFIFESITIFYLFMVEVLILAQNFSLDFMTSISTLILLAIFLNYTINILMNAKIEQLQLQVPLIQH